MLVYLAGAMEFAPDGGRQWRADLTPFLTETLSHRVFDPCLEENRLLTPEEIENFRLWRMSDYPRFKAVIGRIIDADLDTLINHTGYVVCFWDQYVLKGAGTHGELTMAHHHNIPVYLVHGMPFAEISSWVLGCATEVFANFDSLKEHLSAQYG